MSDYTRFTSRVAVRPDDIDLNQHVHNAKYYDYVLAARYEQMERDYLMPMSAFLERDMSWFVRASYIEHKRPLCMGDAALVTTAISEVRKHGVRVEYEITRESDGQLSARGWFDYVLIDIPSGRPKIIPEDVVQAYSV